MLLEPRAFLARARYNLGRRDEALEMTRDIYEKAIGNDKAMDQKHLARIVWVYGNMLEGLGRGEEAEEPLREAVRRLEATDQMMYPLARMTLQALQRVYETKGDTEEARRVADRISRLVTVTRPTTLRRVNLTDN
jgi:tetratricopeptide (TPR) repeat protein